MAVVVGSISTTTASLICSVERVSGATNSSSLKAPSARSYFFSGSHSLQVDAGSARLTCRKEGIHPKFYSEAEVFCKGEHVISVGGTQEKYVVDVWSGNHPFFLGDNSTLLMDADRVDKFKQRYGNIGTLCDVPSIERGMVTFQKKKAVKGKGGKK